MTPFLSEIEVLELCSPLTQPAAQGRYLRRLGVRYSKKADGRPLVGRQQVADMLAGRFGPAVDAAELPNADALKALFSTRKKGGKNGTTAQKS